MATHTLAARPDRPDRSVASTTPSTDAVAGPVPSTGRADRVGRPLRSSRASFDRIWNLRDLGGHRGRGGRVVRSAALYRSDALHHATDADRITLAALGLRKVIDLRTSSELGAGRATDVVPGVAWHHRPVLAATWGEQGHGEDEDPTRFLAERYREMLVEGRDAIAGVFALLALPSAYPCLFHCAAGKDRTGVIAALVLGVLGVHDEDIVDDYAASAGVVEATLASLDEEDPEVAAAIRSAPAAHLAVAPAAVQILLDQIHDEHGSVLAYLRGIGVPFEAIEAMHDHLLL